MKNNKKNILIVFLMAFLTILTACSCGGSTDLTYTDAATEIKNAQSAEIKRQVEEVLVNNDLSAQVNVETIKAEINSNFTGSNTKEIITKAFDTCKQSLVDKGVDVEGLILKIENDSIAMAKSEAKAKLDKFYNIDNLERHQIVLCEEEKKEYITLIENATIVDNANIITDKEVEDTNNLYQILSNYSLSISNLKIQMSPIRVYSFKEDGFFGALFNNVLVYPIGWLLQMFSKLFGGFYFLGVLIVTVLIRTIMMPVYNSTNNMTLKMQLMQPELNKLEAKYQTRQDPDSQRAKQMEQMQLYKKYKMGFGGCFAMLLQFPVFLGVYQAVSRMHLTDGKVLNSPNWVQHLNTKLFGLDLFLDRGETWSGQFFGVMIILVLVVATQVLQQILTNKFQKANHAKSQENIPEYKRQAMQQNQMNGSMKFMMYFMIIMMAMFVYQSAAALGFYWLIGNIYSLTQMILNHKFTDRRMARLKKKLKIGE